MNLQTGGTGTAPVKSGVSPDFGEGAHHENKLIINLADPLVGFGRDAQNYRPEAGATQIILGTDSSGTLRLGGIALKWADMFNGVTIDQRGLVFLRSGTPSLRFIGGLLLLLLVALLAGGCTTTQSYQTARTAGPARPPNYPIPVYSHDDALSRPCELLGHIAINSTGLTVFGGTVDKEMTRIMRAAHQKGADVVRLTEIDKPGFNNPNYAIQADLLRYADHWETVSLNKAEFLGWLQQHQASLDPIEGIWSDGGTEEIGIMRNTAKPGRDFIAFILNSARPNWPAGYKKMDLARVSRPFAYRLKFYGDDFTMEQTTVSLDHPGSMDFIIQKGDAGYPVILMKISPPPSTH